MNRKLFSVGVALWLLVACLPGCDEGQDDWNGSAKISGYVYTDASHTRGVSGVQVILESDPNSENPYLGPDRWVESNAAGYFERSVFLGRDQENPDHYEYVADMSVGYFWRDKAFRWSGGVTVSPGTHFTLPAVDTTMFQ
ncbi:hypothetical protein HZB60_06490 [candidate division KSB1 bacterium]|nr:hypothetical protein [candidate division KSB1 bacterium]